MPNFVITKCDVNNCENELIGSYNTYEQALKY